MSNKNGEKITCYNNFISVCHLIGFLKSMIIL